MTPAPDARSPAAARSFLLLALLASVALLQLLPHPKNVSPVAAMALFGSATFGSRLAGFAVSAGAFALAGLGVGLATGNWDYAFHALAPVVYGCWGAAALIGFALRQRRRLVPIAGATLASATLFFLVTNFAVWATFDTFLHTAAGLLACYVAGLPHFGNTLAGDALYAAFLFGGLALAERRFRIVREPLPAAA